MGLSENGRSEDATGEVQRSSSKQQQDRASWARWRSWRTDAAWASGGGSVSRFWRQRATLLRIDVYAVVAIRRGFFAFSLLFGVYRTSILCSVVFGGQAGGLAGGRPT
jgi:hypothetical protein